MHVTVIAVMSNAVLALFSVTNLRILGTLSYSVLHLKNKNKMVDPVTALFKIGKPFEFF